MISLSVACVAICKLACWYQAVIVTYMTADCWKRDEMSRCNTWNQSTKRVGALLKRSKDTTLRTWCCALPFVWLLNMDEGNNRNYVNKECSSPPGFMWKTNVFFAYFKRICTKIKGFLSWPLLHLSITFSENQPRNSTDSITCWMKVNICWIKCLFWCAAVGL